MTTERDLEVVDWIGRLGAAGAAHVTRDYGVVEWRVRSGDAQPEEGEG